MTAPRNTPAGPVAPTEPASRTSSTPSGAPTSGAPTFEDAIKRLSEIVQSLERGDLPLEDSLRLFEEGVGLSRLSQRRLDAAQKRVEQLLGVDDEGRARTAPFETGATDDEVRGR